eukprot:c28202_g1_i1.p1 GENE.c28202_g1_i1~~c28202_g1_i1.p1  ORF type:complete len:215 (-),score=57.76 c28202_g1_i1:78-722(-)
MLRDALVEADPVLKVSDKIFDPQEFWTLTDHILKEIEISKDGELNKAQSILKRIRDRKLYKFCGEFIVPENQIDSHKKVTAKDICDYSENGCVPFSEDDIVIHNMEINYGLKDILGNSINPVNHCQFFDDWNSETSFPIGEEKAGTLLVPKRFCEKSVRIFCRSEDESKQVAIAKALEKYCKIQKCPSPVTSANKRRKTWHDSSKQEVVRGLFS